MSIINKTKLNFLIVSMAFLTVFLSFTSCGAKEKPDTENASSQNEPSNINQVSDAGYASSILEDIAYFAEELPKNHLNAFHTISKEDFESRIASLTEIADTLDEAHALYKLAQIAADIGDSHTRLVYVGDYRFPLLFWMFGEDIYIINTSEDYKDMLYAKVLSIENVEITEVLNRLETVISYENESNLKRNQIGYLRFPVTLYALDIIPDKKLASFTLEKDGNIFTSEVLSNVGENPIDFCIKMDADPMTGQFHNNYTYEYLQDSDALLFSYNFCADRVAFNSLNTTMFEEIRSENPERIVIDLRSNSGGDSEVLNPFTNNLKNYMAENPGCKVFILTGKGTYSSAMFAIFRIKEAAPDSIVVGEPTGGTIDGYGEVGSFTLPNSQVPVFYSKKYFEQSKMFAYNNTEVKTFYPDIILEPTIDDYVSNLDVVMEYALYQ